MKRDMWDILATPYRYINRIRPNIGEENSATDTGSHTEPKSPEDDFDWGIEPRDGIREKIGLIVQSIIQPLRSAIFIRLLDRDFPREQRGMFYVLLVYFHEDLYPPLYVYSAIPAILMWYLPWISPKIVFDITRGVNFWKRSAHQNSRDVLIPGLLYYFFSFIILIFIDFRQTTTLVLEPIFGPASKWPSALLPIFPGIFLWQTTERPNSINGFVPENYQGILMAVFIRACTAVLPSQIQWIAWTAYAAPNPEHISIFIEFVFCTFCWIFTETSPMGGYAIWLMVNQYLRPQSWFRNYGGTPSVILQRERRGTSWYIATLVIAQLVEAAAVSHGVSAESLILYPQVWIPLSLIFAIGVYLLKYGLLMRVYKYKHKPLQPGENIRLLRLRAQPCLPNAPIQCDMIYTSLECPPQYIAISHRWDPVGAPQEMILIDGGLFPVSKSLYSLLLAKRSNLHPQYLWIDSVCINQEDTLEKGRQVGIMRNIFEEAEMMIGWLGEASGAEKAINFIKLVNKTKATSDFAQVCSDSASGWNEFRDLIRNDWFERVWIIQEIAVAKIQILRYGNQEINWVDFVTALTYMMGFAFETNTDMDTVLDGREGLSALIMEEVRLHVANLDLIRLRDTMKLGLRFRATLSIDKVYALLGLVSERHTPLFHPKFGVPDDAQNTKIFDSRMIWKDVLNTMDLINNIFGTASGSVNSRRGRAILSSGVDNSVRYMLMLTHDLKVLHERLDDIKNGTQTFEKDTIQPDYSGKSTAQLVYTYIARDMVKQGDGISFIRHAGLGHPRNSNLIGLPSWIPDWSSDIDLYLLPWRKHAKPIVEEAKTEEAEMKDAKPETKTKESNNLAKASVFQDDGLNFLLLKGSKIGTIAHSTSLSQNYTSTQMTTREEVQNDFDRLSSNFQAALNSAEEQLKSHYASEETLEEAFYTTLAAGSSDDDVGLKAFSIRYWSTGLSADCPVSAALQPDKFKDYWKGIPDSDDPETLSQHQEEIFKKYLFHRRMTSSANSKFAHLIRADITPSFAQYRVSSQKLKKKTRSSLLNMGSDGILSGYAKYVDYTIGRSFIITDSGLMGLAPSVSEKGDIIVEVNTKGRIIWLVLRQQEVPEPCTITDKTVDDESEPMTKPDMEQPSHEGAYRLIGEAYIHPTESTISKTQEEQWFKLW